MSRKWRRAGLFALGIGAAGVLAALVLWDQVNRHRRDLFNPNPFRRLAALRHMVGQPASVDAVTLLRDFAAWEPRPILREHAAAALDRMERQLQERADSA